MNKVSKSIDDISPDKLRGTLREEDLELIRNGSYTATDYKEEIVKALQDQSYECSKTCRTYTLLWYITQHPKVTEDIKATWRKVVDEYDGPKVWGEYSLYDPLTSEDLSLLMIYDNLVGRPPEEQEQFLIGMIPGISSRRQLENEMYKTIEESTLKIYPNFREECDELEKVGTELGDPIVETYRYNFVIAQAVKENINNGPANPLDIQFIEWTHERYAWSKHIQESIKALEVLEQGPYRPLIDWIKSLTSEDKNVYEHNIKLAMVKNALDLVIETEGLTEDNPGDLKKIKRKLKKKIERLVSVSEKNAPTPGANKGSPLEECNITPLPTPSMRTLGVDKGNQITPLMTMTKTEPTTIEYFDSWHAQAIVNFAPKDKARNEFIYHIYTPQGEYQGLTAIERAMSGFIGTLLRDNPNGTPKGDRYPRVEITENEFIKKLMGLKEGENIKTHQEDIYNTLMRMSMSRIEVDIPKSNRYKHDDKFIKAIEELYVEMNGAEPVKNKSNDIRISVEKNMLVFDVVKCYYKGSEIRKYIFETMPFNEYLAIKYQQVVKVKNELYRTPALTPASLTQNARAKAEEYKVYSKDRTSEGMILMLENNLENLGLKDWVNYTIEVKRRKYGSPVILEYDDLYVQVKGASTPLSDRTKRTLKTNLKKFLVYLVNNPESDVIDFKEVKEPHSRKYVMIHVYLKESKIKDPDDGEIE